MPIATVRLPNGKIADVRVPQGASNEDIQSFLMSQESLGKSQEITPAGIKQPMKINDFRGGQPNNRENIPQDAVSGLLKSVPVGLGNAFIGGVQAITDLGGSGARAVERTLYGDNMIDPNSQSNFGGRLANEVQQRKTAQAQLPTSERVGIAIGENLPYLATGAGTGARVAAATGSKIAGLAAGGAVGGATAAALSPQQEAGLDNRALETAKGAAIGAAVGGGLGIAGKVAGATINEASDLGKNILSGFKSKSTEELASIADDISKKSNSLYKAVDEAGATFKPEAVQQIMGEINGAVKDGGSLFKTNHPKTIGLIKEIEEDITRKGGKITLSELDQYRKALSAAKQETIGATGLISDDGRRLSNGIKAIDNFIESNPAQNLLSSGDPKAFALYDEAKKQWATYRKFDTISNLVKRADGDPNRLKTLVKNLADNDKKLSGFSDLEKQALRRASRNNNAEGILKALGKFGFDLGSGRNIGNSIAPGASILFGGGVGAVTATAGTIARQAQKLAARGKVEDVLNLIRGQEPEISSKVIQSLPAKTRHYVITNILSNTISKQ